MYYLQKIYIQLFDGTYVLTSKVSEKTRNGIISICCGLIMLYFIAYYSRKFFNFPLTDPFENHVLGGIVIFVMTVFSVNGKLRTVKWHPLFFWTYMIAAFGILIISFIHSVGIGFRTFSLLMIFVFPAFSFVWNNRRDYSILFIRMSVVIGIIGTIYYLYCFSIAFDGQFIVTNGRGCATMTNPNYLGMLGMVLVAASLYLIIEKGKYISWFILSSVFCGIGICMVKIGVSRTSMLAVIGALFAFVVFFLKLRKYSDQIGEKERCAKKACLLAVVVILCVLSGNGMISANNHAIEVQAAEYAATLAAKEAQEIQPSQEAQAPQQDQAGEAPSQSTSDNMQLQERLNIRNADLNQFSSGRINIWSGYIHHLNLLGHDFDTVNWVEVTGSQIKNAHNNFLDYSFRCGIIVGFAHLLLELIAGIMGIVLLFNKKYRNPAYLFTIVFLVFFAVESMIEIATLPFLRVATFFYFFIMMPLFNWGNLDEDHMEQ